MEWSYENGLVSVRNRMNYCGRNRRQKEIKVKSGVKFEEGPWFVQFAGRSFLMKQCFAVTVGKDKRMEEIRPERK